MKIRPRVFASYSFQIWDIVLQRSLLQVQVDEDLQQGSTVLWGASTEAKLKNKTLDAWKDRLLKNKISEIDPFCCPIHTFSIFLDALAHSQLGSFI